MSIVIDIAWARPTVAQIKTTGAVGVMRYFSTDTTKNLHPSDVAALHAAGLGVGDVWETTTGRATQGYQDGIDDATIADGQRRADGLPADQVVYFAVDEDTSWPSVADYFRGAAVVLGQHRVGVYGGYSVIEGAYAAGYRYLWQTLAWSGGRRSAHACLYQNGRTVLSGNADVNDVLAPDWGQYPHPSGDEPMTPADVQLFLNTTIPSPFRKDSAGKPLQISVAEYLEYGDAHFDATQAAIAGLKAQNTALASAVAALSGAVAKLAGGGVDPAVVAKDVLTELSTLFAAAAPPAKP